MRGAGINTIGGRVQVLELDVPLPIASDEVLIAVKTAGVGNWDESVRIGDWDANSLRIAAPGRIRESPGRTPWSICRVGA
jgi:D-arabinose 1-dehydrogenase-like Zn-dependent alcohol dehydrogenase